MRKITAIFLTLALVMAFVVACGRDDVDQPTSSDIISQYVPSTTEPSTTENTQDMAYVLTTSPDRTVPWSETTRFEIGATSDMSSNNPNTGSSDYNIDFNVGELSKPDVNISEAPSVPKTTADAPDNTKPSTTNSKPGTTNAKMKAVRLDGTLAYGDGKVYIEVDPSGWDSTWVAASKNINVSVDGVKLDTTVTCKVPSKKNGAGNYDITVDLSKQEIESGATVTFTIPAGLVQNKTATQYNSSYAVSITV